MLVIMVAHLVCTQEVGVRLPCDPRSVRLMVGYLPLKETARVRLPHGVPASSSLDEGAWLRTKMEAGSIPAVRTSTRIVPA